MATSLARIGAILNPHYAAKLELVERQALAGFQAANALEAARHENRLAEMDRELSNRLAELHTQHQLEGDKAIVDSIIKQMEGRAEVRNEAFKMIMEAAIKVKLGKIEHQQNVEKQERYLAKLYDYLFELCRNDQEQAAKDYIDKLYKEAVTGSL